MKLQSHLKNYLLAVGILLCLTSYCDASAFLLAWDRDNPVLSPDTFYNDIESQNFHGTTNSPGVQAVMSARHYGEDPLSSTQWGLIDDSLPWNHSADGWIVRHGFSPDWKGSIYHTESGEVVEASYISIMVTKPVGATLTNL